MRIEGDELVVPYLHSKDLHRIKNPLQHGIDYRDQVFSYLRHNDKGKPMRPTIHIHVAKLLRAIQANPQAYWLATFQIEQKQTRFILGNNGVEREHIYRLRQDQRRLMEPGIIMDWEDGQHTVIDGNHRYVALSSLRHTTMDFYVVTFEQVKPFLLDLPEGFGV